MYIYSIWEAREYFWSHRKYLQPMFSQNRIFFKANTKVIQTRGKQHVNIND